MGTLPWGSESLICTNWQNILVECGLLVCMCHMHAHVDTYMHTHEIRAFFPGGFECLQVKKQTNIEYGNLSCGNLISVSEIDT